MLPGEVGETHERVNYYGGKGRWGCAPTCMVQVHQQQVPLQVGDVTMPLMMHPLMHPSGSFPVVSCLVAFTGNCSRAPGHAIWLAVLQGAARVLLCGTGVACELQNTCHPRPVAPVPFCP